MTRTDAEKYATSRYQDRKGNWYTTREFVHDIRYCDLCDSEDVEPMDALATVDGWYGGIRIVWANRHGMYGPQVREVICRACRQQHGDAYQHAERRPVTLHDEYAGTSQGAEYYCPAHKAYHFEDHVDAEMREAQWAEMRELVR